MLIYQVSENVLDFLDIYVILYEYFRFGTCL